MFDRTEPFAKGQAARKLESDEHEEEWFACGEPAQERWETERPTPANDRCSTILPVAPNAWRERWGLDPPEMWLDELDIERDTPFEPSPLGPDTIPMPPDPNWAPTVRP